MAASSRTDLTGFAALVGESFQSRVDQLERLLRSRHYPSLGAYKERLLAQTMRSFLPKTVEVGTGFVLFPCKDETPPAGGLYSDPLNQSGYDVSKQCDILVFDPFNHPPVFQDGDFVVLRPESVRAVVEVKGTLTQSSLRDALQFVLDFAQKWQRTQRFYAEHHQGRTTNPQLHCFCWSTSMRGARDLGAAIRRRVADFYRDNVRPEDLGALPLLHSIMIYNQWEICETGGLGDAPDHKALLGWYSRKGRFVRIADDGQLFLDRDRTIASLLADLHWAVGRDQFNRFFSYMDEVRSHAAARSIEQGGITWAWELDEIDHIRRHNLDQLSVDAGD